MLQFASKNSVLIYEKYSSPYRSMMHLLIAVIVVVFAVILHLCNKKASRYNKLTENIPEVKSTPIVGLFFKIFKTGTQMIHFLDKVMADYGSDICKARFGPWFLIGVSSPEIVGEIISNNNLIDKPFFYDFFFPRPEPSTLFISSGNLWRKRRKIDAPAFHFQIFEGYLDIFNSNSKIYVENIKSELGKSGFDVWNYNSLCTLDIILESFLGTRAEIQKQRRLNIIDAFHHLENEFTHRSVRPWLYPDMTYFLTSNGKRSKRSLKLLYDFLDEVLNEREKIRYSEKSSVSKDEDTDSNLRDGMRSKEFLDIMFEQRDNGNMSQKDLKDEVLGMVIGGYSTNSTTISFVMYCLMKNQHVQDKVVNELNDIFHGSDRDATMDDLQKMVYLDKVIKETLRLYSSVPFILREMKEDVNLKCGYTLPKGAIILIFMYHMHRRGDVFPNPKIFDPERFNVENISSRNSYAFLPFSGGSRICIGYKFAMLEGKVILSSMLRKYKILPPTDESPDVCLTHGMVLRSTTGVHIKIKKR